MALKEDFEKAANVVQELSQRPSNDELLQLYALYKQSTEGDIKGSRPGMLDIKGKAKYDAWAKLKSKSSDESMQEYINLVKKMLSKNG